MKVFLYRNDEIMVAVAARSREEAYGVAVLVKEYEQIRYSALPADFMELAQVRTDCEVAHIIKMI